MKQAQEAFTLQSDFSKLKMTGEAATLPMYIDLAIYDLMADKRKRSVNEVVSALALLGYMRNDVNRRMVAMLHKNHMFVAAHGGRGKVLYELKKGAVRPDTFKGAPEAPKRLVTQESEIVLRPQKTVDVTYRNRRKINLSEINMQTQQPTAPGSMSSQWDAIHKNLGDGTPDPTAPVSAEPTGATEPFYTVERTDAVRVALWKVMHDLQPYKYSDLCTLLDHIDKSSITYHLRKMVATNMVTVDKSEPQSFVYRLVPGTPMPEGLEPYKPNTPAAAQQPQLDLKEESVQTKTDYTITTQKDTQFNITPAEQRAADKAEADRAIGEPDDLTHGENRKFGENAPMQYERPANIPADMALTGASETKAAEVPLIEVGGIMVKGQNFSYKEARELLAELRAAGYGTIHGVKDRNVGKHMTISWTVTIGVVQVTPFQANDIALALIDELE